MLKEKKMWALAGVGLAVAVAATSITCYRLLSDGPAEVATECAVFTNKADAQSLLSKMFPGLEIISAEPLPIDRNRSVCALEVDMYANAADKNTRGFVYVMPDGEHVLNGPLLDRRSRVSVAAPIENTRKPAAPSPVAGNSLTPSSNAAQPQTHLSNQASATEQFFEEVRGLTSLQSGVAGGHPVYVLLDPLCRHCGDLFRDSNSIAEKYNIQFNWIPMYTTQEGWVMSALVNHIAKTDTAKALQLIQSIVDKSWSAAEFRAEIEGLTDAEYADTKRALMAYTKVSKGTPLVTFRVPSGGVEVINGKPFDQDWAVLLK